MTDLCSSVLHCLFGGIDDGSVKKAALFESEMRESIRLAEADRDIFLSRARDKTLLLSNRLYSKRAADRLDAEIADKYTKLDHIQNGHAVKERQVSDTRFIAAVKALHIPGIRTLENTTDKLYNKKEEMEEMISVLKDFPLASSDVDDSEALKELDALMAADEDNARFEETSTLLSAAPVTRQPSHTTPANHMETILLSRPTKSGTKLGKTLPVSL